MAGVLLLSHANCGRAATTDSNQAERKLLYVAEPGIRNYLEYGGHGVLVFDIDHGHRFVNRIPAPGLDESGQPLTAKGVCPSASPKRPKASTPRPPTGFAHLPQKHHRKK